MENKFPRVLQATFENAILSGHHPTGCFLELEDLVKNYMVSEGEMLKVLSAEFRKGLVQEKENNIYQILGLAKSGIESVFVHAEKSGLNPISKVRAIRLEEASPLVAAKLELEIGAIVYRLERTRFINGETVANQINYIPYEICPGLENDDISNNSFQLLLEHKYHTYTVQGEETCALSSATEEDAEILNLNLGNSIIEVQRIATSATHRPVVWAVIRIHPEKFHYVESLWPQAVKLLK